MTDETAAQAAILEKAKQLRRSTEDEKRRMEEGIRRLQSNMDRLNEEKEALEREKDKLRRVAKTEIKTEERKEVTTRRVVMDIKII